MSEFTRALAYSLWDVLHVVSLLLVLLSPVVVLAVLAVLVARRGSDEES